MVKKGLYGLLILAVLTILALITLLVIVLINATNSTVVDEKNIDRKNNDTGKINDLFYSDETSFKLPEKLAQKVTQIMEDKIEAKTEEFLSRYVFLFSIIASSSVKERQRASKNVA
jgi:hypothetical protein